MLQGIYAYNSIYSLLNISGRDLKNTSKSPASTATSMLFGTNLNQTYKQLINYDSYKGQTSFNNEFRGKIGDLKESSHALSDPEGDVYAARDADFKSESIEVTVEDNADVTEYKIEVDQVALTQLNETESVDSEAITVLTESLNHIEIEVEGETLDLHIEREEGQSNADLFESIANTINAEDLDITAQVRTSDTGDISLALVSNKQGEEHAFNVEGNLAEALDLTTVDRVAQDAVVRVDDAVYTSNTNLVELDNGRVGIKVNAETTIPFDLQIEVSGRGALSAAKTFANSFNQAMAFLQGLNNVQASLLGRQYERAIDDNAQQFEALGITLNESKELVIDDQTFNIKFEENEAEAKKILTEFKSSVNQVERRSTQALRTPASTFSPSSQLPSNVKPYNLSYDQALRPVPINNLFARGSIIDVFF